MDASQATRVWEAGVNTPGASVAGPSAAIAAPQGSPQLLTISRRRRSTAKVFDEAMRTAGSARRFRSEPVPDDVLYRVLDNARFAPSGRNRQGWRVIVMAGRRLRQVRATVSGPLPGLPARSAEPLPGKVCGQPALRPDADDDLSGDHARRCRDVGLAELGTQVPTGKRPALFLIDRMLQRDDGSFHRDVPIGNFLGLDTEAAAARPPQRRHLAGVAAGDDPYQAPRFVAVPDRHEPGTPFLAVGNAENPDVHAGEERLSLLNAHGK